MTYSEHLINEDVMLCPNPISKNSIKVNNAKEPSLLEFGSV